MQIFNYLNFTPSAAFCIITLFDEAEPHQKLPSYLAILVILCHGEVYKA